ncbi:MAG: DUF5939 domain-containing protein [Chloroflexi bacterium]|nr:DUF5939 domain-containing protein [Chloroflexota bacterium]MCA2000355.1 DUF5939 domain-containing protein [Chloroflexota bacterium]
MAKEYHYQWAWELNAPPEALWSLVSDTNRFNRDTGLPPVQFLGVENGARIVRFKIPILNIEWEEKPFEWFYPYRFGILRRYRRGPLSEMRVECRLAPREPSGSLLTYELSVKTAGRLGDALVPLAAVFFGVKQFIEKNGFGEVFKAYDRIASQNALPLEAIRPLPPSPASRARLDAMRETLKSQGVNSALLDRLQDFLLRADDFSLQRIRPYALADAWGLARRSVLEAFLRATRAGYLDMYWDLLCPECRGVAEEHRKLGDLHGAVHCNTCRIDFDLNFDHNVEVIFRPNPTVRLVETAMEFCVGSPQRQPHIVFSMVVPPREELPFSTMLVEGKYSLRSPQIPGSQLAQAVKGGAEQVNFYVNNKGWEAGIAIVGLKPSIRLVNQTDEAQVVELAHTAWSDQAATAADVTVLQAFRDLFSSEALRSGEQISVGAATLMFTDLRNSTRLYREIGDAPAFGRVREHFEILEEAIAAEGGSVVKTMGDAVMAVFRKPLSAVRAVWSVQKEIAARSRPTLFLKVGIHHGPCIAVKLNDKLDYFGSTVNIAARLPSFSAGGEAVISEAIRNDEEVGEFLEKNAPLNSVTRFQGDIRGYDQSLPLWKIRLG